MNKPRNIRSGAFLLSNECCSADPGPSLAGSRFYLTVPLTALTAADLLAAGLCIPRPVTPIFQINKAGPSADRVGLCGLARRSCAIAIVPVVGHAQLTLLPPQIVKVGQTGLSSLGGTSDRHSDADQKYSLSRTSEPMMPPAWLVELRSMEPRGGPGGRGAFVADQSRADGVTVHMASK